MALFGNLRTFDLDGWRVSAGLHYAAKEDGDVCYVAVFEDWGVLSRGVVLVSRRY